jgi:hypothetical protein
MSDSSSNATEGVPVVLMERRMGKCLWPWPSNCQRRSVWPHPDGWGGRQREQHLTSIRPTNAQEEACRGAPRKRFLRDRSASIRPLSQRGKRGLHRRKSFPRPHFFFLFQGGWHSPSHVPRHPLFGTSSIFALHRSPKNIILHSAISCVLKVRVVPENSFKTLKPRRAARQS